MKGVYACSYLQTLEQHFGVKLHEHFDLVAGTSTGGIIALGLGARLSAEELLHFYKENGPIIFPGWKKATGLIPRLGMGYCYGSRPLKVALDRVFGDRTMADSAVMLCIPSVDASICHPTVFKSSTVTALDRDLETRMADVALATSAAPWFLPVASFKEAGELKSFVDGGLWANNPAMIALVEALKYHCGDEKPYDGIQMLSVGLPTVTAFRQTRSYRKGLAFVFQVLDYAMESHKHGIHYQARFLLTSTKDSYFRVEPSPIDASEKAHFKLDSASKASISRLTMLGRADAQRDKGDMVMKEIFKQT